jgi:hypothetical protein
MNLDDAKTRLAVENGPLSGQRFLQQLGASVVEAERVVSCRNGRRILDGDKANFTKWMLTQGWEGIGDSFLRCYAESLTEAD